MGTSCKYDDSTQRFKKQIWTLVNKIKQIIKMIKQSDYD